MKIAIHPDGTEITFTEYNHCYRSEGRILTSGTTFIGEFFEKFDADTVAAKCATKSKYNKLPGKSKYEGMTAEDIKAQWELKGVQAGRWGSDTHEFIENLFKGKPPPEPIDDHEAALFEQATLAVLKLYERFEFLAAEKIIFSPRFGIAGMVDLIMRDPRDNYIIVLDWKTNEKITMDNPFQHGLSPIEHLEDCHFIKYSLQLTLYEMILRCEGYYPDAAGFRSGIIHLTENNNRFIRPRQLVSDITWMMF